MSSASGGRSSQRFNLKNKCSNNSNGSSPGSGPGGDDRTGPWGSIATVSGPYVPGSIDYTVVKVPRIVIADDSLSAAYYMSILSTFGQRIDTANIPYNPFGPNSNTVAYEAIEQMGFSKPKLPIWVPGINDDLLK